MNRSMVLGVALAFCMSGALTAVSAHAKDKAAAEKAHDHKAAGKDHADHAKKEKADKEKCAEMMEHNKAPDGGVADADKKGCGMMMGKKKGLEKDAGEHAGKGKKP